MPLNGSDYHTVKQRGSATAPIKKIEGDARLVHSISFEFRKLIRDAYESVLPEIIKYYPQYDPYITGLDIPFTPIENNVWTDIRFIGLPIKCPQFPVKQYFIDFADPVRKIGIEVDGAEYHIDRDKDRKRQAAIESEGWTLYRIQGWQTLKSYDDFFNDAFYDALYGYDEEDTRELLIQRQYENYLWECSEGICRRIQMRHYQDNGNKKGPELIGKIIKRVV